MLSSKDKYFDSFVKKVVEVYNDEKNNILEDSITDPFHLRTHIKIDENTKQILESGKLTNYNQIYEFYNEKESYESSLLFQKDEFILLFPIIKYHIENFFNKTDMNVSINNKLSGYRDNYSTFANVDGLDKFINIYYYKEDDNSYFITLTGILNGMNPIDLSIKFLKDRIEVKLINKKYDIYSEYTYLVNNEKIKQIINIYKNNQSIVYENKDLDECENNYENITDLDCKTNFKWFILPWNAIYGINNEIKSINEEERIVKTYSMYLCKLNNSFMKKENYSNIYKKSNNKTIKSDEVVLDDILKNTTCICINSLGGIYAIETSFLDTRYPNGYYQEHLEDKYFYHVFESENGLDDLRKEKLISVSKKDILNNSDLVNESISLKLIKGDK